MRNNRSLTVAALKIRIAVLMLGALVCSSCSRSAAPDDGKPLPVIATLPDFSLVESDERRVQRSDLMGHVWLANFVFTNCSGPCPTLTMRMRSIALDLAKTDPEAAVKIVTFTLDPKEDSPPVLRAYADRFQADPKRWWFLTGIEQTQMHELVQKGFLQAVQAATKDAPIVHSTYFVLLDRSCRIRAVYDGFEASSKPLIMRDIARLLAEPQ